MTRVPAVDGIRHDHKLRRPDRITDDLNRKMAARVARGGGVSSCRPNLVRAIGPVPCRRSAQAVLWSAKKLSGGSASDAVNRGSKRNRVAQ